MLVAITQAVLASARRAVQSLLDSGDIPAEVLARLEEWDAAPPAGIAELETLLAPYVLAKVAIHEDGAAFTTQGDAPARLIQHGWRSFLVRVENPHAIEGELATMFGYGVAMSGGVSGRSYLLDHPRERIAESVRRAWLRAEHPDSVGLSGAPVEYRVVSLCSRDAGTRSAELRWIAARPRVWESVTRPSSALEFQRSRMEPASYSANVEFVTDPARDVTIGVREPDGRSTMASITVRDSEGRPYPSTAMRLAPDMIFQQHVYRATGEELRLPDGTYSVVATRGPEYRPVHLEVEIGPGSAVIDVDLDRWVDPAAHGFYSGDVHIHAAGCSHYSVPTEGVNPETMIRHVRGEGLSIGSVLTWGPCYYHQKTFFSGDTISPAATLEHPDLQAAQGMTWVPQPTDTDAEHMLRYDVEVSGFPSSHSGHSILLALQDQDYPGTQLIEDWPSWNLPIHRWGKEQGAFTGYAHCGNGLDVGTEELPNYIIPAFSSNGSNEIIVDVPHGVVEFQAGAEFSPAAELNVWYHLLNVGYRTLTVGETDYPCVYDDGPGIGRTYVRMTAPPSGPRGLEAWVEALRNEPSYFGDGRSHVFDVAVDGNPAREQIRDTPGSARFTATVVAWLPEEIPPSLVKDGSRYSAPVGWHLERSRIEDSRRVLVEVVVNGYPVASQEITADAEPVDLAFDVDLPRSSWVALRILRSVHTQPVFVEIGGAPIRASKRSAQWLADSVEALWNEKNGFIRESERAEARAAYDAARDIYLERLEECETE